VRRIFPFVVALGLTTGACSKSQGPAPSSRPAKADRVTVYMYSEYIDPNLPAQFEDLTGWAVRIDVYEATEEMMAKLQQAGGVSQYDVVVVSDHAIPVLAKLGLIQPLNHARLPNLKNLAPRFKSPSYDPNNQYSVPYQWGTVGLMYRRDKLPNLDPSWAVLLDPAKQPGPFLLIDSMRDMMAVALKYLGFSVNSRDVGELKRAGELILQAKKSPKALGFEGGVGGKNKVVAGEAALAVVYNGDAVRAMSEDRNVDFVLPKEGGVIWVDAMTIPAKAPNPIGAHKFIDFILDARVGAQLSNFNRYATPNTASMPLINKEDRQNPSIYPPDDMLKKLEYLQDVGADTRLYDEVWTAVKSR